MNDTQSYAPAGDAAPAPRIDTGGLQTPAEQASTPDAARLAADADRAAAIEAATSALPPAPAPDTAPTLRDASAALVPSVTLPEPGASTDAPPLPVSTTLTDTSPTVHIDDPYAAAMPHYSEPAAPGGNPVPENLKSVDAEKSAELPTADEMYANANQIMSEAEVLRKNGKPITPEMQERINIAAAVLNTLVK